MLSLIKLELYKLIHSKGIILIFILLIIMTVSIYGFWMKSEGSVITCYAVEVKSIDDKDVIEQAIKDVNDMGYSAYKTHGVYSFDPASMPLFDQNGVLYNKYKDSEFLGKLEKKQHYDYFFMDADDNQAYEKGIFGFALLDLSAIAISSILFAAFFFGIDFHRRTYNGAIYYGVSRNKILISKIIIYILLSVLLSLIELTAAFLRYSPGVLSLPLSYTAKFLLIRICADIGILSLPIIFTVLFKNIFLSMGTYFIFILLFMSNISIINIQPFKVDYMVSWFYNGNVLPAICISVLMIIVSTFISGYIFKKAKLK